MSSRKTNSLKIKQGKRSRERGRSRTRDGTHRCDNDSDSDILRSVNNVDKLSRRKSIKLRPNQITLTDAVSSLTHKLDDFLVTEYKLLVIQDLDSEILKKRAELNKLKYDIKTLGSQYYARKLLAKRD